MDVLEKIVICTKGCCDECEFNETRKRHISGFVFCMEKLLNEAGDEIRRLRGELNER